MSIVVQKFGGTSLSSKERTKKAAEKVIEAKKAGHSVVVVVSAMGREGDPYATDTLINLVGSTEDVSLRELDLLLNCGEIISAVVFSQFIKNMGYKSVALTGAQAGIITDDSFNEARILKVKPKKVLEYLKKDEIVVVSGFQGVTENGDHTTLGRGGSDTTAAALGVALDAEFVEIFTDVDGVKTADPNIVKDAKTLNMATYDEICELARQGAKVVHQRAVEIIMHKNIPLKIRSTFTDEPGTLVTNNGSSAEVEIQQNDRLITGITYMKNLSQIIIKAKEEECFTSSQLKIFKALASSEINIDFISVSPCEIKFTVNEKDLKKLQKVIEDLSLSAQITRDCAMISVVGASIRGIPGIMARIVEALVEADIPILQTTDSYTSIWVLVKKEDMEKAIRALHEKFNL